MKLPEGEKLFENMRVKCLQEKTAKENVLDESSNLFIKHKQTNKQKMLEKS